MGHQPSLQLCRYSLCLCLPYSNKSDHTTYLSFSLCRYLSILVHYYLGILKSYYLVSQQLFSDSLVSQNHSNLISYYQHLGHLSIRVYNQHQPYNLSLSYSNLYLVSSKDLRSKSTSISKYHTILDLQQFSTSINKKLTPIEPSAQSHSQNVLH